ncbi:CHAT domain-containing protein [Streptomyces sp. NPDC000941]
MHEKDVAALRDRAERAATEALACTASNRLPDAPPDPAPPDPARADRVRSELDTLEAELAAAVPDTDPLLCTVRARLGGLYADRYQRAPTAEDRARGLRLLRAARATGALGPRDRTFATLDQTQLMLTPAMVTGWDGTLSQFMESLKLGRRISAGDPELTGDLAELVGLLTELASALPEKVGEPMSWIAETLERSQAVAHSGDLEQVADMAHQMSQRLPGGHSELLRTLGDMAAEFAADGAGEDGGTEPPTDFTDEEAALTFAQLALVMELQVPGTIRSEDLGSLVEAMSQGPDGEEAETAMRAALSSMAHGVRTGDADRLAQAAELINGAVGDGGSGRVDWMANLISPGLLAAATTLGGNLKDRDQARAQLDRLFDPASSVFDSAHATGPGAAGLRICNQCMHVHMRTNQALGERDSEKLEDLLGELLDLLEETDDRGEWRFLVLFLLGQVQLSLAMLDGGATALRTAVAYLEEATRDPKVPAFARPMMDAAWAPALTLFSLVEPDPVRVREAVARARRALEGPASTADWHVRIRQALVYALLAVHRSTGDGAVLDEAIGELEQARRDLTDLTDRAGPEIGQKVLWDLAEAYHLRGDQERDDQAAAVGAAQESLRMLAEDVLLQLGAEHGLEVARAGASRGLLAAQWAAVDGRVAEAVEALENGRGLVLRAAAAAAGVPEQLAARGEAELAEQWRNAVRDLPPQAAPTTGGTGTGTPEDVRTALARIMPTADPAPGLTIPSTLRRRALDALRRPDGGGAEGLRGLLGAPGVAELREGLRAVGSDVLVYLVPGQGAADGAAVLVPRTGRPTALELPGLGAPGREPLERYLDAGARRSAVPEGDLDAYDEAHRQWEAALEALCDWAGEAVFGPVLGALGVRTAEGPDEQAPVRLVLVPCGNLGAVPWHAARLPAPSAYRYVCEGVVVSYAASGGEFLRAVRRGRMAVGERVVLVDDPSGDLMWAQDEVAALRAAYYPDALLYGWHETVPEGAGTPEDVLSHLPGSPSPASLLHLVVHGLAGVRPTDSALHLAEGRLTVTRILDVPVLSAEDRAAAGPLIVLSACETDLSSRDHDEALTPTTALLARGATDVVGSRWKVSDSASAALMVVFHHQLTVMGLAPPDALRAAQLWMLDPDRRPVPGLRGELLAETEGNVRGLARVVSWAGFIHQGNPAADALAEEQGPVGASRGRAARAADKAATLSPPWRLDNPSADGTPSGAARPRAETDLTLLESALRELEALDGELAAVVPEGDPLLCTVRVRLGCLYADLYARNPTDDLRARGLRLLRGVRATRVLDPQEGRVAAIRLVVLLSPPGSMHGWEGKFDQIMEVFDLGRHIFAGDPETIADLTELRGLLAGLVSESPEGFAEPMRRLIENLDMIEIARSEGAIRIDDLAARLERLASMLESPDSDYLRSLSSTVSELVTEFATGEPDAHITPIVVTDTDEAAATTLAQTIAMIEMSNPGTVRPDDLPALVEALGKGSEGEEADIAWWAALGRLLHGMRTGDPDLPAEAAELLGGVMASNSSERTNWLSELLSLGALGETFTMGGNLADRDQMRARLDKFIDLASVMPRSAPTNPSFLRLLRSVQGFTRCAHLQLRIAEAAEEGDSEKLQGVIEETLDLLGESDEHSEWRILVLYLLGLAHGAWALLDGGMNALRTALAYFEETMEHPSVPAALRPMKEALEVAMLGVSSLLEPDPPRVLEAVAQVRRTLDGPVTIPDQHVRTRQAIASALLAVHKPMGDRSVLEEAVGELEQARRDLTERMSPDTRNSVLWELAKAYQERGDRERDDLGAAVGAAQESLKVLAENVLLQLGAEHGLEAARAGASCGLLAAQWAAVDGRVGEAVESLENGRGLVLRAAAAAAGVPEQLAARGEAELAEQWRNAVAGLPAEAAPTASRPDIRTGAGTSTGMGSGSMEELRSALARIVPSGAAPGFTIPSTLRRRALDALRLPDGDGSEGLRGLLGTPGLAELREGLRAAGAVALVYLMPGQGTEDGAAILVRRTGEPTALPLPLPGLGAQGRQALERYLDAGARRSALPEGDLDARDEAQRQWEAALEGLCDWAGSEVFGPVLDALGVRTADSEPGRPARLVLVPCGNLGAVPWHAARLPAPRGHRYVCESVVVSYAASGGEFLRAAGRGRMAVGERAVLVADPSGDLMWAEDEVAGLRAAYYPDALLYGWHEDAPEDASGTPEDVLCHLPGSPAASPASLLHLVVHGLAGLRPTDSALHLAEGRLTVTRILDVPAVSGEDRVATGPLIVLSACETDLSSRDHDEALTPTTALLARGATDVVGSRWKVSDSASAALMVVFHHHLTVTGLAPPDALRAAQLWMLDPDRRPVPGLTGDLLAETEGNVRGLARVVSWAGFIHQGNPAAQAAVPGGRA